MSGFRDWTPDNPDRTLAIVPRRERPLDTDVNPLVDFAAQLRHLRRQSGSPPYRELAKRAHYSATTLSEAAGGRKLPSLQVTLAYVTACHGDPADWERRWRTLAAEMSTDQPQEPVSTLSPYVGLAAFQQSDADRFHGRDELSTELFSRLTEKRFLGVFGPSGSGKSSLLRAGLAARLADRTVIFTPGAHPLAELANQLSQITGKSADELRAEFTGNPFVPHLRIRQATSTDLVLIVDQFEELFTLCRDEQERTWFIEALIAAATDPASRAKVVLGTRADFYGHCGRYPQLVAALRDAHVLVGPMTTDELREAITAPAEQVGCRVETALVARLIADATGQPGVLPLVSHALLQTWLRRRGTILTLAGYEAAGGIEHALAHSADETYAALDLDQQLVAKQIFLRLIALGDGTEDTKRRTSRSELDHSNPNTAIVLDRLAGARLVTIGQDSVEITHEALIRHWPRLRGWLAEDRHGHDIHRQLTDATNSWEAVSRDPGALYRGTRLTLAQDWATRTRPALTPRENSFLTSSAAAHAAEQAAALRRTRRLRQLVALLLILLVLAVISVVLAVSQRQTAQTQRKVALASAMVAKAATMDAQPEAAMLLAAQAYRLSPSPETRSALLSAQASPFLARLKPWSIPVSQIVFSDDGRTMLTVTVNGIFQEWDVATHQPVARRKWLNTAKKFWALRPKGDLLAIPSGPDDIALWDTTAGREIAVLPSRPVRDLVFSADGQTLAAVTDTGITMWNVGTRQQIGTIAVPSSDVSGVPAVQPGATVLVYSRPDGTVVAWDFKAGKEVIRLPSELTTSLAYSPDGQILAINASNGISIWTTATYQKAATLGESRDAGQLAFSADSRILASAGRDRTILWDVAEHRQSLVLPGHTGAVMAVAFDPTSGLLATAGLDLTVALWELAGPVVGSHPATPLTRVTVSPTEQLAATSGGNGVVTVWDTATHREVTKLGAAPDRAWAAMFSPTGRTLGAADQTAHLRQWDVGSWHEAAQRPLITSALSPNDRFNGAFSDVAFGPDGDTAVVIGDDVRARVFDLAANRESTVLTSNSSQPSVKVAVNPNGESIATLGVGEVTFWDPVGFQRLGSVHGQSALAFSPTGQLLATTDSDNAISLWDTKSYQKLGTFTGHTGEIKQLAFTPDGRTLASASDDKTVKFWDVESRAELLTLTGHTDAVTGLAFTPDGQTLVTTSRDTTLRFWDLQAGRVADRICGLLRGQIGEPQWAKLISDVPFDPYCA